MLFEKMSEQEIIVLADKITENLKKSIQIDLDSLKSNPVNGTNEEVPIGVDELSILIGKAKQTIYGLVCRNEIPYHKGGRKLYFFKSQIIEWIKNPNSFKLKPSQKVDNYLSKKGSKKACI